VTVSQPPDLVRVDLPDAQAGRAAQRRAWACLWGAFAIWLVLFSVALVGLNGWRKTSYVTPNAELLSRRGIVLYQGPRDARPASIGEGTVMEEGGTIEVPVSSEATIRLGVDGSTVYLRPSSILHLDTMRVGRFNRALTQVRLEQRSGALTFNVVGDLPDGRELELRTPHTPGPTESIKLTKGEYLVWVQPDVTRLTSYLGQARAELGTRVLRPRDGKWVAFGPERQEMRQPLDLPEPLLANGDFSRGLGEAWSPIDVGEKGRPDVGGARTVVEETVNNRLMRTLHVVRETAKDTHNETGLRQDVNRDVSAYRSITFSAWVKVNYASLDGGGYAGSEYPIMLRIQYVAENGGDYTWTRGFYTRNEANRPVEIGELVPEGTWQRFTLDMTKLTHRPAYITHVDVLGSGHDFDAQVADVRLSVE
jgi:hypothetical protein